MEIFETVSTVTISSDERYVFNFCETFFVSWEPLYWPERDQRITKS